MLPEKRAPITRVVMPNRDDGSRVPNPVRYVCSRGHVHPSRKAAVKCNQKNRPLAR